MSVSNSRFSFLIASSSNSINGIKVSRNKDLLPFIADMKVLTISSVSVLEKLNESFSVQAEQLDSTKSNMEIMSGNVASVKETSSSISVQVKSLYDAKNGLMEIISDLSAISEENAASTEETNASMEELNATFSIISESANKLQSLAEELKDNISYFKVE